MAGPLLAGSTLVWGRVTKTGGMALVQAPEGHAPGVVSTVGPFASNAGYPPFTATFTAYAAASIDRVAIEVTRPAEGGAPGMDQAFGAAVGGQLEPLSSDCSLDQTVRDRSVAVSGQVVAYVGPACGQPSVTDFTTGTTTSLPPDAYLLRVAGNYVAYVRGIRADHPSRRLAIDVIDRTTNTLSYSVPADTIPGTVVGLDLQDDGKVLFTYNRDAGGMEAAWASLQEPEPHELLRSPGLVVGRIASDQAVIMTRDHEVPHAGVLRLVNLTGQQRLLAAPVDENDLLGESFDFDGSQIAWSARACAGTVIHVSTIKDAPGRHAPPDCRLRLLRAPKVVGSTKLRLAISCAGFDPQCAVAGITVVTPSHGRSSQVVVAAQRPTAVDGAYSVEIPLSARGRKLVATHHRLKVRVTAFIGDDAQPHRGGSPTGAEKRSAAGTICLCR